MNFTITRTKQLNSVAIVKIGLWKVRLVDVDKQSDFRVKALTAKAILDVLCEDSNESEIDVEFRLNLEKIVYNDNLREKQMTKEAFLSNPNGIFVFGSNLKGIHGAGAALRAKDFGAVAGRGQGLSGRSYALPTKDDPYHSLKLGEIAIHVDNFLKYASENPTMIFIVTRVGCGLAGYVDREIAPLFKNAPGNCWFHIQWKDYLEDGVNLYDFNV